MKIIHTADWHIGKTVAEHNLLEDQRYYLEQLVLLLAEEKADVLIVAGDLYDRSVPSGEAVELVDSILTEITAELGIPVLAIAGNHDSRQRLSFGGKLLQKQGLFLVGSLQKKIQMVTLSDDEGPVNFYLLPFFQPGDIRPLFPDTPLRTPEEAYNYLLGETVKTLNHTQRNILITHGFLAGSEKSENEAVLSSELSVGGSDFICTGYFKDFDYVALGHLHAPQSAGLNTARYSGSLLKYSVDEANQNKKILCVECGAPGDIRISERRIKPLRDLRIVRGSFDDILSTGRETPSGTDDYVFAEITQSEPELEAMARLRSVYPNALGLKYINRASGGTVNTKNVETLRRQTPDEIFGDFYREITGEILDPAKQALAKSIFHEVVEEDRR